MDPKTNKERLLRVIRGLQLLQRTNLPASPIGKLVTKTLPPLLKAFSEMPADAAPVLPAGEAS